MLLFPVFVEGVVDEKQNKLREIMKMMGLHTSIYWIVTYLFDIILYLFASTLIVAVACAFGFRLFLITFPLLYILTIVLYGFAITSFALLVSVFFSRTRTATVVGYILVFATGIFSVQIIDPIFRNVETPEYVNRLICLYPPFAFYRALVEIGSGVFFGQLGLQWSDIYADDIHLIQVWLFFFGEAVIYLLLGLYFVIIRYEVAISQQVS